MCGLQPLMNWMYICSARSPRQPPAPLPTNNDPCQQFSASQCFLLGFGLSFHATLSGRVDMVFVVRAATS